MQNESYIAKGDRWARVAPAFTDTMLVRHSGALLNISSEEVEAAYAVVEAAAKIRGASLVRVEESMAETTIAEFYGSVQGEKEEAVWSEGCFVKAFRNAITAEDESQWVVVIVGEMDAEKTACMLERLNTPK